MTWDGFLQRLTRRNVVLGLYAALALAASGQQLWSAATSTRTEPPLHRYNNYVIFERSWDHLVSGRISTHGTLRNTGTCSNTRRPSPC